MPETINQPSVAAETAADPKDALAHFARLLSFETDCWDVHAAISARKCEFVLLDVRSPQAFRTEHVPGAINLPYAAMDERTLTPYPRGTLFVVYCSGPHCNGADRAAVRLASLGRKVKKMLGGVEGWRDSGFDFAPAESAFVSAKAL
jgi:rhodanese-related sulfurtransferase